MIYHGHHGVVLSVVVILCLAALGSIAIADPGFSSIPTSSIPAANYQVFVSFRGKDTRRVFLSHLIKLFDRKQISAFVDSKLLRGNIISQALVAAIERSLIALVIFSVNYAYSRWCLDELVKISECREKQGQVVIPVFYDIDPSNVRNQKGSYGNALIKLKKKHALIKVQPYRSALKETAELSGFHSTNFTNDAELLDEIVNCISMKLNDLHAQRVNAKGFIGIERPIAHITSLLRRGSHSLDVRAIGIWGTGGIGKTTIAEEVFCRLCHEFHSCVFLAKVREESQRHGIISLKDKLFSTLLKQELKIGTTYGLPGYVKMRLVCMKVLIVLDDVNDSDQMEILVGARDWFGLGSRIIITSRDKQVLVNEVDHIHEVGVLDTDNALKLFIMNAFKDNHHHLEMEYYELSKRVVNYSNGIPLVLKVLGHLLNGKDKELWESQLYKLKKFPNKKIYDVLKLSYDELDYKEQNIFLDIACSFGGLNLVVGCVEALMKDSESDNSVAIGLERLKDKSLISVSEDNIVHMLTIIQEMGWEIVRQKSSESPGTRSRLWDPDETCEVLKNDKGTEAIRSIRTDLSAITKLELSPHVFEKMSKLQFINFHSENDDDGLDILPQGLECLPTELRYLRWMNYPLKSIPERFSPENLVILDLSYSQLEILWHGVKNLQNLKQVRLYGSKFLKELPDFSKAINLELLDIRLCTQLTTVHPSIFTLNKLTILD